MADWLAPGHALTPVEIRSLNGHAVARFKHYSIRFGQSSLLDGSRRVGRGLSAAFQALRWATRCHQDSLNSFYTL